MTSDSTILRIGTQCSFPSCDLCDFLPIVCSHCQQAFCSDHRSLDAHKCPVLAANMFTTDSNSESDQAHRCDLEDCRKPSLVIAEGQNGTCTACHKAFCAQHRYQDTHNCPYFISNTTATTKPKKVTSRAKVPIRKSKPPTDPVKLAQWHKMEVMKMRHRAIPADPKDKNASPPPDERLHVKIIVDEGEKVFWLRKNVVTGRALDLLVAKLNLSFPGNPALSLSRIPYNDAEELVVLQNDLLLVNEIEDGSILLVTPVSQ